MCQQRQIQFSSPSPGSVTGLPALREGPLPIPGERFEGQNCEGAPRKGTTIPLIPTLLPLLDHLVAPLTQMRLVGHVRGRENVVVATPVLGDALSSLGRILR